MKGRGGRGSPSGLKKISRKKKERREAVSLFLKSTVNPEKRKRKKKERMALKASRGEAKKGKRKFAFFTEAHGTPEAPPGGKKKSLASVRGMALM